MREFFSLAAVISSAIVLAFLADKGFSESKEELAKSEANVQTTRLINERGYTVGWRYTIEGEPKLDCVEVNASAIWCREIR